MDVHARSVDGADELRVAFAQREDDIHSGHAAAVEPEVGGIDGGYGDCHGETSVGKFDSSDSDSAEGWGFIGGLLAFPVAVVVLVVVVIAAILG
ncbi:MAG: hypothetical protein KF822_09515 [Steroidobacteraceae bacterium]|nr:hypothetical protein [Steroidobacteraceae bacterium]